MTRISRGTKNNLICERVGPTVILQDLVMPGVNGLDLLREYRSNPFTRAVPVIVLSSKKEPTIKQLAFESGANDYMVKLPHKIELQKLGVWSISEAEDGRQAITAAQNQAFDLIFTMRKIARPSGTIEAILA